MIFPTNKKKRAKRRASRELHGPGPSPSSSSPPAETALADEDGAGSTFSLLPHAVHFSKRLRVMVDAVPTIPSLLHFDQYHHHHHDQNNDEAAVTTTTDNNKSWCSSTTSTNTTASTQSSGTLHTTTPTAIENNDYQQCWRTTTSEPPQTPPPAEHEQESRQDDNDDDNSRTSFHTSFRDEQEHQSTPAAATSACIEQEDDEDDSTWYSSSACGGAGISAAAQRRGAFTDGMVLRQRRRLQMQQQPLYYSSIDDYEDDDDAYFEYDRDAAARYFSYSDHPIKKISTSSSFDYNSNSKHGASSSPLEARNNLQLVVETEHEETFNKGGRRSKRNKYLIPAESTFKLVWDILTGILSFVHAYATHMAIRDRQFMNPLIRFCEVCFVVDVLLNFVSERKVEGRVLSTYQSVISRYLTSWFVIDVLSLVPFELLYVQPIIEQQNRRRWFQKFFFRSRAVVRVTRALRIPHFRAFGQVSRNTGLGANRLIRLLIRYVPKYLMFWRNMKAAVAVRLLRHIHSLRRVWCNLIGSSNVTAAANISPQQQLHGVGGGDDNITNKGHIIPGDDDESVDILDVGVVVVPSSAAHSRQSYPPLTGEDAPASAGWEYVDDDDDDCCGPY